jgi:hypothetical protein
VSSLWEQRAARNEALFREVNENISRLEEQHGQTQTAPVYICECADAGCTDNVGIDLATYRRVRQHARFFFVRPGHEDPQLERIVERHDDYLVVEKTGAAGAVAEQTQN